MQNGGTFQLTMRRGPAPNQRFILNQDIIGMGRDISSDVIVNDPEVSRNHARMIRGVSGYSIEDLGSTNGVFVNGERISGPRRLRHGDEVALGETVTFLFESYGEPTVAAPRPEPAVSIPAPVAVAAADEEEEDEGDKKNKWLLIGCLLLLLVFCIIIVVAGIIIDSNYLWCDIPIVPSLPGVACP